MLFKPFKKTAGLLAALVAISTFALTLAPAVWFAPFNTLSQINNAHIAVHAGLFGMFALLLGAAWGNGRAGYVLALCLLFAVMTELVQQFSPGRNPSIQGVIYDMAGAGSGVLLTIAAKRLFHLARLRRSKG